MAHINITVPENAVKVRRFAGKGKKGMDRLLQDAYKKSVQEDKVVAKEWGAVSLDGLILDEFI